MNHRLSQAVTLFLVALAVSHSWAIAENHRQSPAQNDAAWVLLAPPDEELTVRIPALPTVRTYPVYRVYDPRQERLLAHCDYSGYGAGLAFMIHSFKAAKPQRLSGGYINFITQDGDFERDLSFDGINAKLYRATQSQHYGTYTRRSLRFYTHDHLYIVVLATLEANNPAVDQFLSSLRIRNPSDATTPSAQPDETVTGEILTREQLTRPVIVIWKSEPWYTEAARMHHVVGNVTLEAVFAANGYVTNINVTKGLKDGLTESAIDAARNIRFFPAEKDGKPVSQRTQLEFTFNLF